MTPPGNRADLARQGMPAPLAGVVPKGRRRASPSSTRPGGYTISIQEADVVKRGFGRWVPLAAMGAVIVALLSTLAAPECRAATAGSTAGSQRMVMAPGCYTL